ncbi:hypothetical protein ANN_19819 [Periplaneta americana]|uniref:Uncharacterized protein n=1 Tax=Periplaneta americana TaxID=6978 RepID=A0ABQ8SB95_PERAM|nr:hypothetical protein ANN_19819 [Periplaneta americana]
MLKQNEKGPKKPIVHTDETWVHTHTVKKCWQHNEVQGVHVNQSLGQRAVIVHAGGEMGFIEGVELIYDSKSQYGDYHDEMNGENYNKWLKERLIPNLPSECIVVLHNASYRTVQKINFETNDRTIDKRSQQRRLDKMLPAAEIQQMKTIQLIPQMKLRPLPRAYSYFWNKCCQLNMNIVAWSGERNIIKYLIAFCDEEKQTGQYLFPGNQATKRATDITGFNNRSILVSELSHESPTTDLTSKYLSRDEQ